MKCRLILKSLIGIFNFFKNDRKKSTLCTKVFMTEHRAPLLAFPMYAEWLLA